MGTRWYYSQNGWDEFGPFTPAELRQLAADGRVQPSDQVWKDGQTERVAAERLKGLFDGAGVPAGAVAGGSSSRPIPDELWPDVLPVIRSKNFQAGTITFRRRSLLWIGRDEIVFARIPRLRTFDDSVLLATSPDALALALGARRLDRYKNKEIESLGVRPLQSASGRPRCALRVRAGGRRRRTALDCSVHSVPIDALQRLLGARLEIAPVRSGADWWLMTLIVILLVAGLATLAGLSSARGDGGSAAVFLAPAALLLGTWAALVWRGRSAHRPRSAPLPRPNPIWRFPYRSVKAGWALKIAGFTLLGLAYVVAGRLVDAILGPAPRPAGDEFGFRALLSVNRSGLWSLFGVLLSAPGLALFYLGYLVGQPDPLKRLERDHRPRVVFLRSFEDDARHSFNERGAAAALMGVNGPQIFESLPPPLCYLFNLYPLRLLRMAANRNLDSSEEQLAAALRPIGPLVAIGRPNERFVTPGAARFYVGNDEWQSEVLELIRDARFVILQPAATAGVWWEVKQTVKRAHPTRILICLVSVRTDEDRDLIRTRLSRVLPRPLPALAPGHQFLSFDPDWTPQAEYVRPYSPFTWPLRGTTANLRRTLAPFLEARNDAPAAHAGERRNGPPASYPLVRVAASLCYLAVLATAGLGYGLAVDRFLAPSPASLIRPGAETFKDRAFVVQLNGAWHPQPDVRLPGTLAKARMFQAGPHHVLLIVTYGIFRPKYDPESGPDTLIREATAKEAERGLLSDPEVRSAGYEEIAGQRWVHGVVDATVSWIRCTRETWFLRAGDSDYLVSLVYPARYGPDDPLVGTVRAALATFQPEDAAFYLSRGNTAFDNKDYDKAIADYTEAIRIAPDEVAAYENRALARENKRAYDQAIVDLSEVIRRQPWRGDAYADRGRLWYRGKRDYDRAIADFERAIQHGLSGAPSYVEFGNALDDKHEPQRALQAYALAIEINPGYAVAYRERAVCLQGLKEYDDALANYAEAIRRDPADHWSFRGQAWIWATCPEDRYRDGALAVKSATRACELTGWKDARSIDALAAAFAEAGDFQQAVLHEEKALALTSEDKDRDEFRNRLRLYQNGKPFHFALDAK